MMYHLQKHNDDVMYVWAGVQLVATVFSENVFHNPR